jgi:orotidine-5'-phosphate decarboxylase
MMINSSRAILYAKGPGHWTEAAAAAAKQTRDDINAHR